MNLYVSFLSYKGARYAWVSLALCLASIAAYLFSNPQDPHNGGTWLGYTLGTVGALLIFWLAWLGIRKRNYATGTGTMQGWASAHIYLGLSLIVVATLHAGFQIGFNVHTLAYILMMIVILSGGYGIAVYRLYPKQLGENRGGKTLDDLIKKLTDLNKSAMRTADKLPPDIGTVIKSSISHQAYGGGVISQLKGKDTSRCEIPDGATTRLVDNKDQTEVIRQVSALVAETDDAELRSQLSGLLQNLLDIKVSLTTLREDIRIRARLKIWLYLHIPTTIALLIALVAHIISVFIYW